MSNAGNGLLGKWQIERSDLIPAGRYFDPGFQALEDEHIWLRAWQMACRLEEIPEAGDFVEYEILGRSAVIVRQEDGSVRAFENACRHRGVKLCQDRGSSPGGFTCPFHAWRWSIDGACKSVFQKALFDPAVLEADDIALAPVRADCFAGCVFINFDKNAADLRSSLGSYAKIEERRQLEDLRTIGWFAIRVPANWKAAVEAFMESYHVLKTHPQLVAMYNMSFEDFDRAAEQGSTGSMSMRIGAKQGQTGAAQGSNTELVDRQIAFFKVAHEGMGGAMYSARDVAVAQRLKETITLPDDPVSAMTHWRTELNKAIYEDAAEAGLPMYPIHEMPLANENIVHFFFPNLFFLPPLGAAASYRIRPLGPEECLFEIWALERFAAGNEPGKPQSPKVINHDDPAIPLIPAQDYSNLPLQQLGLHAPSLTHLRLASKVEGLVGNFQKLIDGFIERWPDAVLFDGIDKVNGPIDQPIKAIGPAA